LCDNFVLDPITTEIETNVFCAEYLPMKQKWEYQTFVMTLDESSKNHLDAVGDEGWELVCLVKDESPESLAARNPRPVYHAVCKRPA